MYLMLIDKFRLNNSAFDSIKQTINPETKPPKCAALSTPCIRPFDSIIVKTIKVLIVNAFVAFFSNALLSNKAKNAPNNPIIAPDAPAI
ncbi:hypothetical protein D9M68_874020 [compost metagenome]